MPYKTFEEDGKFVNYKVDEEGKKIGKRLGSFPDAKKASVQIKALYANESKKELPQDEELETKEDKCYDEMSPSFGPTSWDELEAAEVAFETAEHMNDMTYKFRAMANAIINNPMIEDKAQALVEAANGYAERVKKPAEMEEKDLSDLGKQLAGDNQPVKEEVVIKEEKTESNFTIWKEDGTYRWIIAYSNNQRDKETEIITSESHKEFDQALYNKEWPMPDLWLWHIPFPVGKTDYHAYDESTGYPVAAGHFYKEMDWAAEGLLKAGWNGSSHGMPDRWIQRNKEDSSLIVRHRTKEISFLPNWAAANKNTFSIISKEIDMADIEKGLPAHKRPEFVAAFGEERVKQIEATLESKSKEADEQGIEKKEAKEPTMADVVKALEFLTTELVTLKQKMNEPKVETKEEEFDLVTRLKSLSAIGQETTKVDGRTALAKSGPEEAKVPSATEEVTGLPISLVDKLFQANQAYYNGGAK